MTLISLRNCYHVNSSMVLTRANHLFIHNYIRSLFNIILRHVLLAQTMIDLRPISCIQDNLDANNTDCSAIYTYEY